MFKTIKKAFQISAAIISFMFMFIPEEAWMCVKVMPEKEDYVNSIFNKAILFVGVMIVSVIVVLIIEKIKWFVCIKDKNHQIEIRYGDILSTKKGIKVINFDECFTTKLGNDSGDIKLSSLCGRFLQANPIDDIKTILNNEGVVPEKRKSNYNKKECYKPGTLLKYDNEYLLMAFAKLNKDGLAEFDSLEEYVDCLSTLWEQILIKHGDSNVCVPVFGSGRTKIKGRELSQQELIDIMIYSYKLSENRLKNPHKLIIFCKRENDFSLNKICGSFVSTN